MNFAAENAENYNPSGTSPDPIATLRTLVRVVSCICHEFRSPLTDTTSPQIRASSIRRQYFSAVLKALEQDDLQLLRDVDVRWSSTLLMVERAILLRAVSVGCGFFSIY
jgi:hypothetical protein